MINDEYLRAGLEPANFVLAMSRGANPQSWRIRNVSPGYKDLYQTMAWADENHKYLLQVKRHIFRCEGAAAVEFALIRPTFEVIEEIAQ